VRVVGVARWILPALGIPACVLGVGFAVQAAAFRRPTRDAMVATQVLRELARYRVMRGTELIDARRVRSTCVQGWFRLPDAHLHRPLRGALVLLGNGERLYDVGDGVRRVGRRGRVSRADRVRFLLAGCPRVLGGRVADLLARGIVVDADTTRQDGSVALAISFGRRRPPVRLLVAPPAYAPVGITYDRRRLRGVSDLEPGGGRILVAHVERSFERALRGRLRHV
jgi:hypothetical protein